MDVVRRFSRRACIKVFLTFAFLGLIVDFTIYFGYLLVSQKVEGWASADGANPGVQQAAEQLVLLKKHLLLYGVPLSALIFLLLALLLWLGLRGSFKALVQAQAATTRKKPTQAPVAPKVDKKERQRHDKRMFLYLISLLQREGRLMDFFAEDLSLYEDAQIGAAVRGIHDNCTKVIQKNLIPKPVIDRSEGDRVTVENGFDPAAVKLIGNVTGNPPFEGILRHRGWQARKDDLPTLSDNPNVSIIAPAEVEIE